VILGHSHRPALHDGPRGVYANTGNWYERRTFARLDEEGLHLQRWNGSRTQDIESAPL
jgi:UDP-2,3-diacylglucosamine hydrolase